MPFEKLTSSLSVRLQAAAIFLSVVGVVFAIKTYWHVAGTFGHDEAQVFYSDLVLQVAVAFVANVLVAVVIYNITSKPIKRLTYVMERLTEGELDTGVPYTDQPTEIGNMARKVEIFKKGAIEKRALENQQQEGEKKAREDKKKAMESLATRFEFQVQVIIEEVMTEVEKVKAVSEQMNAIITSNNKKTEAAASGAEYTSRNVNAVASAAEEMSSSVREVARQIQKSGNSVKEAVTANKNANEVAAMLSAAATKIGEIVNLIQSIAGQINLLALNATIESARAGEAGRGFAVVANEVKNLATQTGKATDEISSQIVNIQTVANQVMQALATINNSIEQVDRYATSITSAIHQQSAATDEIAQNIASAATSTHQVSQDIVDVNAASATATQCAENALLAVKKLVDNTERLNQAVEVFLFDVRAA